MRSGGVFKAKNWLTAISNEVEEGGEVLVARRGKPITRLVSAETGFDRAKARRAAEGLRAISKNQSLNGLLIRELITEGRR